MPAKVEDFFEKVTTWREYGKDYEHYRIKLDMARIAHKRWRKTVKIVDSVDVGASTLPVADKKDVDAVKRLLGAIVAAFQEAEKTAEQFESKKSAALTDSGHASSGRLATYQATTEKRQKGTGSWMKLRWVVHDKKASSRNRRRLLN
jgi:hypothetical protein